jgi:hypothetical protein
VHNQANADQGKAESGARRHRNILGANAGQQKQAGNPTNDVSKPSAIVSEALIKEIMRKLRLSLRSSATPLVCRNSDICPCLAAF